MKRQATIPFLLALTLAAATGCQSDFQYTDRMMAEPEEAIKLGYNVLWSTPLDFEEGVRITHASIVGDKLLLVEEPRNLLTALSLKDGSILWRQIVGSPLTELFAPFGDEDNLYINSEFQLYYLSHETGKVQGVSNLEQAVTAAPAVTESLAIFGGTAGLVFAHHLVSGRTIWSYEMTAGIKVSPVVLGASVFVADVRGFYVMLTTRGEFQWKGRTFARVSAQPRITNLGVFVPSEDNTLYALQRLSNEDKWKFRATEPLTEDPLVIRTTIYLPVPGRGLIAINAINGEKLWEKQTDALPVELIDKGLLLNDRKRLLVVDPQTGKDLHETPTLWLEKVIVTEDRSLILISPYGRIQRLDPLGS